MNPSQFERNEANQTQGGLDPSPASAVLEEDQPGNDQTTASGAAGTRSASPTPRISPFAPSSRSASSVLRASFNQQGDDLDRLSLFPQQHPYGNSDEGSDNRHRRQPQDSPEKILRVRKLIDKAIKLAVDGDANTASSSSLPVAEQEEECEAEEATATRTTAPQQEPQEQPLRPSSSSAGTTGGEPYMLAGQQGIVSAHDPSPNSTRETGGGPRHLPNNRSEQKNDFH